MVLEIRLEMNSNQWLLKYLNERRRFVDFHFPIHAFWGHTTFSLGDWLLGLSDRQTTWTQSPRKQRYASFI